MATTYNQTINLLLVESILYLLVIVIALVKANFQERDVQALLVYIAVSCVWVLEAAFRQMGWFNFLNVDPYILVGVPLYGVLISSLLFLHLSRSFCHLRFGLHGKPLTVQKNLIPSDLLCQGKTIVP